jgi:hypothetical protein
VIVDLAALASLALSARTIMLLRDRLDLLTADFARQVIAALREASLAELAARSPTTPEPARAANVARARPRPLPRERVRRPARARSSREILVPATSAAIEAAALRILEGRGTKGVTALQLDAELSLQGFAPAPELVGALLARGVLRDTGFRRASGGNATSAVYVGSARGAASPADA